MIEIFSSRPGCGFPGRNGERLTEMLRFRDVYQDVPEATN
jgi:hypothetical protein